MKLENIIDLTDLEWARSQPDYLRYFISVLAMSVANYSSDYCLVSDSGRWRSLYKVANEVHVLPGPPEYEIAELTNLLKEALPSPIYTDESGGYSKACFFKINDDFIFALFAYMEQSGDEWISIRLFYGHTTPSSAGELVSIYKELWAGGY